MANLAGPGGLPGAQAATIQQINEIIRGATIKHIDVEKAQDPHHGGEVVRIILNGGDQLWFIARPGDPLDIRPDAPTAKIQPFLIATKRSQLKT